MISKFALQIALAAFIGTPYRYGGDNPMTGFDCSGLAQEYLEMVNLKPQGDYTAHGLFLHYSKKENGTPGVIDTGSLVFFGTLAQITHVGIIYDGEVMIEARGGDRNTTDLASAMKKAAYTTIRYYKHRKDFLAVIKPVGLPW